MLSQSCRQYPSNPCALCPVLQRLTGQGTCHHQQPNYMALDFQTHICGCIATCPGNNACIMHATMVNIAFPAM